MKILGLCGSLRKSSSNYSILKIAQKYFWQHEWNEINLVDFPYFDPDNQFSDSTPAVVNSARKLASQSDLIFISTPEYAHGIPGILKNGLEWLFHDGTHQKKIALVVGATQGEFAQASLIETLHTMDFNVGIENTLVIKGIRSKISTDGTFKQSADEFEFNRFCDQFADLK
ncbi:MAG: NADPH-dependent FMN reductase [Pseudobdellovibrionaceae bacterium]